MFMWPESVPPIWPLLEKAVLAACPPTAATSIFLVVSPSVASHAIKTGSPDLMIWTLLGAMMAAAVAGATHWQVAETTAPLDGSAVRSSRARPTAGDETESA